MPLLNGMFTSVWDGESEIVTPATLDTETGEVTTKSVEVSNGLDTLNREFFTDSTGEEYPVCPVCHEYVLKSAMVEGIGHALSEVKVCSNPDCENQQ